MTQIRTTHSNAGRADWSAAWWVVRAGQGRGMEEIDRVKMAGGGAARRGAVDVSSNIATHVRADISFITESLTVT